MASLRDRLELNDSAADGRLETRLSALRLLAGDLTSTDERTRLIPRDNGIGAIDAALNTLLENRQGRHLASGSNAILESAHSIETYLFAVSATPQLSFVVTAHGTNGRNGTPLTNSSRSRRSRSCR